MLWEQLAPKNNFELFRNIVTCGWRNCYFLNDSFPLIAHLISATVVPIQVLECVFRKVLLVFIEELGADPKETNLLTRN